MIKNLIRVVIALVLLLPTLALCQTNELKNYLGTANAIQFKGEKFHLVWSSHPADNYYKHEYLPTGDTLGKFKTLILLEATTGNAKVKDIVAAIIANLEELKEDNPIVNFETFERDGEVMIDFLMSENSSDGIHINMVERNVYLLKAFSTGGESGVLLFGVSNRAYGNDINNFFKDLKANRFDMINQVGSFTIPKVSIVD